MEPLGQSCFQGHRKKSGALWCLFSETIKSWLLFWVIRYQDDPLPSATTWAGPQSLAVTGWPSCSLELRPHALLWKDAFYFLGNLSLPLGFLEWERWEQDAGAERYQRPSRNTDGTKPSRDGQPMPLASSKTLQRTRPQQAAAESAENLAGAFTSPETHACLLHCEQHAICLFCLGGLKDHLLPSVQNCLLLGQA